MLNKLKGWITNNTVTKDPNDKILLLDPAGKMGFDKVYEKMRVEDTGLRQEALVHVVSLYERVVARLLMNDYQVNTGLFYVVPRFTGVLEGGLGNPKKPRLNIYTYASPAYNTLRIIQQIQRIKKRHIEI